MGPLAQWFVVWIGVGVVYLLVPILLGTWRLRQRRKPPTMIVLTDAQRLRRRIVYGKKGI